MKMKCIIVTIAFSLALSLATAKPLNFGERIRKVLEEKGIDPEKLTQQEGIFAKQEVGDIWTDCGSPDDIGKISEVTITPDPPEKGKDLSVNADVTLSEKVNNGSIQLKLQYYVLGIPVTVIDETFLLCGVETGLTCPLNEGVQNVKFAQEVPSSAPGGKYTGNAVATSDDSKQIICIDLEFNL